MRALLVYSIVILVQFSRGYRILGVFPANGLSHFMAFEPLMLELAARGHEVVVISKFPPKEKVHNYQHIDVNNEAPSSTGSVHFHELKRIPVYLIDDLVGLYGYVYFAVYVKQILRGRGCCDTVDS